MMLDGTGRAISVTRAQYVFHEQGRNKPAPRGAQDNGRFGLCSGLAAGTRDSCRGILFYPQGEIHCISFRDHIYLKNIFKIKK